MQEYVRALLGGDGEVEVIGDEEEVDVVKDVLPDSESDDKNFDKKASDATLMSRDPDAK